MLTVVRSSLPSPSRIASTEAIPPQTCILLCPAFRSFSWPRESNSHAHVTRGGSNVDLDNVGRGEDGL